MIKGNITGDECEKLKGLIQSLHTKLKNENELHWSSVKMSPNHLEFKASGEPERLKQIVMDFVNSFREHELFFHFNERMWMFAWTYSNEVFQVGVPVGSASVFWNITPGTVELIVHGYSWSPKHG